MTQATSRGMFSGCGVGLISSISGLESIIPVSTSTRPAGWSIVQTNTGHCSPSTMSSAARWALIAGITASLLANRLSTRSSFVESLLSRARSGAGSQGSRVSALRTVVGGLRESTLATEAGFAVELEPANAGVQVTMAVDSMHDQV